jgi:hypothetical protein
VALLEHWQQFQVALDEAALQTFLAEYRRQEALLGTKEEFHAQRQLVGLSLPYLDPRLFAALEQGIMHGGDGAVTWVALVEILSRASYNIAALASEQCRRLIGQLIFYFRALVGDLRAGTEGKDATRTSLLASHRSRDDLPVHEPVADTDLPTLHRSLNTLQALIALFGQLSSPGRAWRHQYQIEALKLQLNVRGLSALLDQTRQLLFSNDIINLVIGTEALFLVDQSLIVRRRSPHCSRSDSGTTQRITCQL